MKMTKTTAYKLVLAGLFTAIGLILPNIFHAFGGAGNIFLPMHIPVILCGLLCGYRLGGVCGLLVPLLSCLITGMPPIYPTGVTMMCELATYGIIAGLLMKKTNVYVALVGSMIGGRIVLALSQLILMGFGGKPFAIAAFMTSAFVTALPGIIIQIIILPLIVIAINKLAAKGAVRING